MSQENVEIVRRVYELWNRGDVDAAMQLFDPQVAWLGYTHLPDAGPRRGVDEVRRWVADFGEAWDDIQVGIERLVEVGDDSVLAFVRMTGRGRDSGAAVTSGLDGHLWTLRACRITFVRLYQGTREALEAVGLSE
jgi:uncharacterized protein